MGDRAQRAGDWHADDDLMAAMGLSEGMWCDAEEEDAQASREEPVSEGGGGGGSEGEGDSDGDSHGGTCAEAPAGEGAAKQSAAQEAAGKAPGKAPAQPLDFEPLFAAAPLPAGEGASSSPPPPPSAGATLEVPPPFLGDDAAIATSRDGARPAAVRAAGPPDLTGGEDQRPAAVRTAGPPAPAPAAGPASGQQADPTSGPDFLQQGWGLVNQAGIVYEEAGARLRSSPSESSAFVTLAQNTKVQILKHNAQARWFAVVTDDGSLGYVADWLVWQHLPESDTNVYRIKKGDTPLGIARDHYGPHFTRWGQDLRFVVNALVYVNQNRAHNGTGGGGLAKKGRVTESWLRATAIEDVFIWLPSVDYLNSIYEDVRTRGGGTGSLTFDAFARVADKVGAFSVLPSFVGGLAHGFLASLGDTVGGLFDLLKSVFTGEIIEDVKKLWGALSKLTIDDVVEALGSWAQSWTPRLRSENPFVHGHARGYFAGYLCAELAMFAVGGGALNALKASKLATKLGQVIGRVAPKLTAAVAKVTAAGRASARALGEAKNAVLQRFGALAGEVITRSRFRELIDVAIAAGVSPADANRLAKVLNGAGISARKVGSWGEDAFTRLASSPRTIAELEATLPLVKAGRIVGLEDWLKFGAKKGGDDAARVAAELREARRLAREHPELQINVGGDGRAPKAGGDSAASFDLSIDDAAGNVVRSVEMTSVEQPVEGFKQLSVGVEHAARKVAKRNAAGLPVPGKIESIVQIDLPHVVDKAASGVLHISRNGDVVLVTKTVPPKHLPKRNLFEQFAENASGIKNQHLVDAVTVVDQATGTVLGRIERKGTLWVRSE